MRSMRSMLIGASLVATLFTGISYAADHGKAHWGYEGKDGPKFWGELDPSYAACKTEKFQSPINIIESKAKKTSPNFVLDRMYSTDSSNIVNNGHTLQVGFEEGSYVSFNDEDYQLVQLHFHTPSENQLNSKSYPAEVHMVHMDYTGNLLVVGIFIKEGQPNEAIQAVLRKAPEKVNEPAPFTDFPLDSLLPTKISFYEFPGSLTTPPCSGNVTWVVMREPIQASKSQLQSLRKIMKNNARDVQPLNGRTVTVTY